VRDRSEQELRRRLTAAGASPAAITATVRRLRRLRYLDDHRFAFGAAEQAARRGYGSEYLRDRLEQHGVADELIEAVIEANYGDETALARQALGRRFAVEPRMPAERARAARFLSRRGFPEAVVFAILGEAC
jgi:regulatory protein